MPKLAVLDIDGTFYRSSLLIKLTEVLIYFEIFPPAALAEMAASKKAWQDRQGSYQKYIQDVIKTYEKNLKGTRQTDVIKASELTLRKTDKQVYVYTRKLIGKLIRDKYTILAISGSPREIVDLFVKRWRFAEGVGTIYEVKNGIYTGQVSQTPVENKKKILLDYLKKKKFNLTNSLGVGDTESDVPFLKLVEQPVCFNPNKALYSEAVKNSWQIVVERKDMVYRLPKSQPNH